MKERLKTVIIVAFCLLSVQLSAKTIYYVKSGATGNGTSWSSASGSIQAMIDEASPGDEVWIAGGTYYPEKEYEWDSSKDRTFKLKSGVSLYGGFFGSETSIQQRKKIDRDNNGKVEVWEFQYETILSGDGDVKDVWMLDDDNRILDVKYFEDSNENDTVHDNYAFFFSGITVIEGCNGLYAGSNQKEYDFIIQDCDFAFNQKRGVYGYSNPFVKIESCNIHHNINAGINLYFGGSVINSYIHYNGKGIETYETIIKDCQIYQNKEIGINGGTVYNCNIYKNQDQGMKESTAYNCHIYENKGGGASSSDLYDCVIENNTDGGTSGGILNNCIIRNNLTVGNGGGCYGGYLKNCKIYNNESLSDGGGVFGGTVWECSIFNNKAGGSGGGVSSDGKYYNCDIYNNYAVSYGGVTSGSYTNCTIANNKTSSGNDNSGYLTNCILVGTFKGSAIYSALTDSYISGDGNFLVTEKELKFVKSTSFSGNASNEKQLEELKNADFRLSQGSSAIDMGKQIFGESLLVEDKNGYPRPMGEKTDIGAHEYLSFKKLPYENKFDGKSLPINIGGKWRNDKLPGKDSYYLYYNGEASNSDYEPEYVTTTFFDKTVSNKIDLSFDVAAKYRTKGQQEKMHIILAYLDSDKRDTIMTYSNTDYIQELHFSKEISSWVKNKVFRVLFSVDESKDGNYYNRNIIYCGITNLKITKQDASVEIVAKDQVCMYDGKPHTVDFQINDTRVDKNKVVVTYLKEGETTATATPPVNAGIYQVDISIEDGSYFGMQSAKLTIEKANQSIQWSQQLRTMKAKEKIQLEATATSGLPVSFSSEDETIAKVESVNGKWWLVTDTLSGSVAIKAMQSGNENYNLANSVLKTIWVEAIPTGVTSIIANKVVASYEKAGSYISVKNITPDSQLYLYDSLGHLCTVKEADNTEIQIPVHKLSKGIYHLLITDRNEKESFKILIY